MIFDEKSFGGCLMASSEAWIGQQLVTVETNRNYSTKIDEFFVSFHCFLSILPAYFCENWNLCPSCDIKTAASVRCVTRKHPTVIVCLTTDQDSPKGNEKPVKAKFFASHWMFRLCKFAFRLLEASICEIFVNLLNLSLFVFYSLSSASEPEMRSPRAKLLWDKWRHVWMMAWDRQKRLHDHLMYLQELERVRQFSWDDWRKRVSFIPG